MPKFSGTVEGNQTMTLYIEDIEAEDEEEAIKEMLEIARETKLCEWEAVDGIMDMDVELD